MKIALGTVLLAVSSGCAIHTQGPIKEVAYDFTDHAFYDRAYAPSPAYVDGFVGAAAPLAAPAEPLARTRSTAASGGAAVLVPPPEIPGAPLLPPTASTTTRVFVGNPGALHIDELAPGR